MFIEPYQGDDDAWDWKVIMFITGMMRSPSVEVLIMVVVLVVLFCIAFVIAMLLDRLFTYLRHVYTAHASGNSITARILQGALTLVVLTWLLSFSMYTNDSIQWRWHVNILLWSYSLFLAIVLGVVYYNEHYAVPHSASAPSPHTQQGSSFKLSDFLKWNKKHPNNNP